MENPKTLSKRIVMIQSTITEIKIVMCHLLNNGDEHELCLRQKIQEFKLLVIFV